MSLPILWLVAAVTAVLTGEWTAAAVFAVGAGFYAKMFVTDDE